MVKNILKNGVGWLTGSQSNITSAAAVIMVMVATSKILGVIKLRIMSARFTPEDLGVFLAAFRIPNLLFEFLVLGALTSAFIPVFTRFLSQNKKEEAFYITSSVINIGTALTFILTIPILLFTEPVANLLAPGFSDVQINLMVSFTRLLLIFQVTPLIIGNFITGMLQSYKKFLIPALAPVLYDVGIIFSLFFLSPYLGLYSAIFGVIVGAFLFLLIQIPVVFSLGYRHKFAFDFRHQGVREIGKLMLPRTVGLAATQIDSTADLILASLLGARAITIMSFAQTLQLLPILLFGSTIAQASLPTLSEETGENLDKYKATLLNSLNQILFLVVPSSVILLVLRVPIVRLAYGAKLFDWEATILTGKTLAFFSLSIFAQSAVQLLARAYYAIHDSKTPVIIGIISVFINVFFSVLFIVILKLPVWSLGLSTSIASIFNALLLIITLNSRVGSFDKKILFNSPIKIFIASLITGICLYIPMKLLDQLVFDTTRTVNLIFLTGIVSLIGFLVYLALAMAFRMREAQLFIAGLLKIKDFRKNLIATPEIIDGEKPNP